MLYTHTHTYAETAKTSEGLKLIKMNDVKRRAYFNYLMLINMFCKTTATAAAAAISNWKEVEALDMGCPGLGILEAQQLLSVNFVIMSFAFNFRAKRR